MKPQLRPLVLSSNEVPAEAPSRILLTPWGVVESKNGPFTVDDESAALILEAFAQHGTSLPIDYEHQTLGGEFASPDGTAPAAGWISKIEIESGVGIFAEVEWTPRARQMLESREYRFLSPVAFLRGDDEKVVAIHSAALTNKPAIVGMPPLVNSEQLAAANTRIAQLEADANETEVQTLVNSAAAAGKLTNAQRPWALDLARRDVKLFKQWAQHAPKIVDTGSISTAPLKTTTKPQPNAEREARDEYRASPMLQKLTSEDAYVKNSARGTSR